jgi:hypothetical protein
MRWILRLLIVLRFARHNSPLSMTTERETLEFFTHARDLANSTGNPSANPSANQPVSDCCNNFRRCGFYLAGNLHCGSGALLLAAAARTLVQNFSETRINVMKRFVLPVFLLCLSVAGLTLVGCGSSNSNSANINGNWNATLVDTGNGPTLYDFGLSLVVNGDGSLSISNFQFSSNGQSCFVNGETETGSFALSGNFSGQVSGKFGLTVQSKSPANNSLTLSGTANGNTISGSWTLTGGTGCSGNGTFTMTKM